jgi:CheY-like chemotaxis protein
MLKNATFRRHPSDIFWRHFVGEERVDKATFSHHLRAVLSSLYDPAALRHSPLVELLQTAQQSNPGSALQRLLIDAIDALQPDRNTPAGMRAWRIYHILRRRYTEQESQRELAATLNLSLRQLQREEKVARSVLVDHLWATYQLDEQAETQTNSGPEATNDRTVSEGRAPSLSEELEEFSGAVAPQMTDITEVLREVLKTIAPLLHLETIEVHYEEPPDLPRVWLQMPLLRQALLDLLGMVVRCSLGTQLRLWTETTLTQVSILLEASHPPPGAAPANNGSPGREPLRDLEMSERLVALCSGTLEVDFGDNNRANFTARLSLPSAEELVILVIDDNADTRLLFQRYLTGSRYKFVAATDTEEGLAMAVALQPHLIILDAMMPGTDGWTLLGQLREHPASADIPVIVCTILAHRELALALGAVDFLRKPVSRTTFLAAIDHQLGLPEKESG